MQPQPSARDVLVLAQIVDLVRSGAGTTRPELEAVTGLGRTVVNDRVREGIDLGVLAEVEAAPSGQRRGRPSRSIRFRTEAGVHPGRLARRGVAARGGDRPRRPRPGAGVPLHRRAGRAGEDPARGARVVPSAAAQARVAGARVGGLRGPAGADRPCDGPRRHPADHSGLGRVRRAFLVLRPLRRPGLGGQRDQPAGPRRVGARGAAGAPGPALRQGGHRHRQRPGHRRPAAPRRLRRRRRHRARARHRRPRRRLPLREDRLPGSRRRRLGPRAHAHRPRACR